MEINDILSGRNTGAVGAIDSAGENFCRTMNRIFNTAFDSCELERDILDHVDKTKRAYSERDLSNKRKEPYSILAQVLDEKV